MLHREYAIFHNNMVVLAVTIQVGLPLSGCGSVSFFGLEFVVVIKHCQEWVEDFVIRHNLCPFAHPFARNNQIGYQLSEAETLEDRIHEFLDVLDSLDTESHIRTILLIYNDPKLDFLEYLDLYDLCEEVLEGESRAYQLASFHPEYCFADAEESDPANLSNRSPYPMIHILRLDDVERAIEQHKDVSSIPQRNIEYLRNLYSS